MTLSSRHSSPMAVLMIAAFLNLAASSNLVTASLQDFIYIWKALKLQLVMVRRSLGLTVSSISIMSVMQKLLTETQVISQQRSVRKRVTVTLSFLLVDDVSEIHTTTNLHCSFCKLKNSFTVSSSTFFFRVMNWQDEEWDLCSSLESNVRH